MLLMYVAVGDCFCERFGDRAAALRKWLGFTVLSGTLVLLCSSTVWAQDRYLADRKPHPTNLKKLPIHDKDPCDPMYSPIYKTPSTQQTVPCASITTITPKVVLSVTPSPGSLRPIAPTDDKRLSATNSSNIVHALGFRIMPDGSSRLVVHIQGVPQIKQHILRRGITYVLSHSKVLRSNNRNPLLTRYFNTPVADARLRGYGNDVLFEIDLRARTAFTVELTRHVDGNDSVLEVMFPAGNYKSLIPLDGRMHLPIKSRPNPAPAHSQPSGLAPSGMDKVPVGPSVP